MTDSKKPTSGGTGSLSRRRFVRHAIVGAAGASLVTARGASSQKTAGASVSPCPENLPICPETAGESWAEPWVWRPEQFPGEELQLNIIEHQNPTTIVGFGNPGAALFTYNGSTPGPTIRMSGTGTLRLELVNHLGLNRFQSPVGPAPDLAAFYPRLANYPDQVEQLPDWCLGEHTNGIHSAHTTNMHTHGLHVRPGTNPDGTHSDDIFVRLMPTPDWERRQAGTECRFLMDDEQVGKGDWEFRIGRQPAVPVHPPGTHWYHPHPHGATFNEVSSGMAGFLIVEGDVDEAIARALDGGPDPAVKAGPYDYRERLMLIQRINPGLVSQDPNSADPRLRSEALPAINGNPAPPVIEMRPGAIERWRILNGSVDGKGYLRFMVLEGMWVSEKPPASADYPEHDRCFDHEPPSKALQELALAQTQLLEVDTTTGDRRLPTDDTIESAKQQLFQLAQDGVTLVRRSHMGKGRPHYAVRDLSRIENRCNPQYQDFLFLEDVYRDANSLKGAYVRPNEVYMAPANRVDLMFQAPKPAAEGGEDGVKVYTVLAKATAIHTEQLQRALQIAEEDPEWGKSNVKFPPNTIVAYLVVKGDPVAGSKPFGDIDLRLPKVPDYLLPIEPSEVRIQDRDTRSYRTRRVTYSGWGSASWPRIRPEEIVGFDPEKPAPSPRDISPVYIYDSDVEGGAGIGTIVVPPVLRTMAIDGRKFDPTDPERPRMLVDTAEQWTVFNNSIALFGEYQTGDATGNLKDYLRDHSVGYPVTRGQARAKGWKITTRGIDHPFHIHVNPFWLMRLEVPDEEGNLVNVLDEPRWQDTVWLPRNGGRIVFRSRFPDYIGLYVNHCHILQHEDNGMMQPVEIVPNPKDANFEVQDTLEPYAPVTLEEAYLQCSRFVDPNHVPGRAQEYPARNGAFRPPTPPGYRTPPRRRRGSS